MPPIRAIRSALRVGQLRAQQIQTYLAAVDGLPRNYCLYPSTNTTSNYFFGTILPDYSVAGGVATAVSVKSTFNAASQMQQVGGLGG